MPPHCGGGSQHQSLEQDLPVAPRRMCAEVLGHALEIDGVEARAIAVGPAVGQHLRDAHRAVQMGGAAEVAEHVVERDAALEQLPGGHRGVEAARQQRDGRALDAQRQPAGSRCPLREEERAIARELYVGGDLGSAQIDARADGEERGTQRALDLLRAHGVGGAVAYAARPHREAPPAHAFPEERLAHAHDLVEAGHGPALGEGDRLDAEDPGEGVLVRRSGRRRTRCVLRKLDEDALVGDVEARRQPVRRQRVLQVLHQAPAELEAGGPPLGADLSRESQQGEGCVLLVGHGRKPTERRRPRPDGGARARGPAG